MGFFLNGFVFPCNLHVTFSPQTQIQSFSVIYQYHFDHDEIMKAIKVVGLKEAEIQEVPLPKLRDDYVLCKVNQVAVNPTDW